MTPVPLDLPLRPSEAAELAGLVFESAERKPLTDEMRNRIAARGAALRLESIVPYYGSLERDPVHHSTYYLAVDVDKGPPQLLHMALATAPTSSIFYKPLLVGRMRRAAGPEIVINTIPFGPADYDALEKFAGRIDNAFLPRPHGSRATIVAGAHAPKLFDFFRGISKRTGRNVAGIGADTGEPAGAAYYAALWAAIRSGWRDGYTAVARVATLEQVNQAALFSAFAFDPASLVRETGGQSEAVLNQLFESTIPAADRGWVFDQFVRTFNWGGAACEFTPAQAVRLSVRFGEGLLLAERVHNQIRQARSLRKVNRPFDFELALDRVSGATTPAELIFCLHWLKARGCAAQLAAPSLKAASEPEIRELVAICRHFQCGLDLPAESLDLVETVSRAATGRLTCSLWGHESDSAAIAQVAERLLG